MPTTEQKRNYNRRNYMTHLYRVRLDSDLADRLAGYKEDGHSLTQLMSELLAAHFDVALPMKYYTEHTIIFMAGKEDNMKLERIAREASAADCHVCFRAFDEAGAGDKKYVLPNGAELCEDCIEDYAVPL